MGFGLIELFLVFGALLAWSVWELLRTRRAIERDAKIRGTDKPTVNSASDDCDT
jgi:hypothetical protein